MGAQFRVVTWQQGSGPMRTVRIDRPAYTKDNRLVRSYPSNVKDARRSARGTYSFCPYAIRQNGRRCAVTVANRVVP